MPHARRPLPFLDPYTKYLRE